jgi:molybdopterin-guanine dinucleotide biosynthesis protein A
MANIHRNDVAGVVLAGGLARRMGGGDKTLKTIGGRPMLAMVIDRLAPQVVALAINANGDPARFTEFNLPVIADTIGGFAGPLAGILAGMHWARASHPDCRYLVSVAGDTPFFPADLAARLAEGCGDTDDTISLAASADGVHPVFGLWPLALADDLEAFLTKGDNRKILAFTDRYVRLNVPFDHIELAGGEPLDPFFNINAPEDVARAEAIMQALGAAA